MRILRHGGLSSGKTKVFRIVPLFFILSACAGTPKAIHEYPNASNFGAEYTCEQIVSEIEVVSQYYGGGIRNADGTQVSTAMVSVGTLGGTPLIVLGGVLEVLKRNKQRTDTTRVLNGMVDLARKKNCAPTNHTALAYDGFRSLGINSAERSKPEAEFVTPATETLPLPRYCTRPEDKIERVYELGMRSIEENETLRIFTVGQSSDNIKLKASHLLYARAKLPKLRITSRPGGKKVGLWVERMKTGERRQLNYLPDNKACASDGVITVDYLNLWLAVTQL